MTSTSRKLLLLLQVLLLICGAIVAAKPLYRLVCWEIKEIRARSIWNSWLRAPNPVSDITPVFWLSIPKVDISTLVIRNASEQNLLQYPCLATASDCSQRGCQLIMAHRDLHFRNLQKIAVGDMIVLQFLNSRLYSYRVVETEIIPQDIAAKRLQDKQSENWLVLMTCFPFYYIGNAPQRFLVWAQPL